MTAAPRPQDDRGHLKRCLALAARARGGTGPNPMVGAVVVQDGERVGEGYHHRPGTPHAERLALDQAGPAARGATLYTNMEPCCHQGRTPPCVQAVLEAGIARVVACQRDPDARVDGRGFRMLREAGVRVDVGELADEAALLNEAYLHFKERGRPFVVAKAALSLDGRMATRSGDSQWITGEAARRHGHRLRAASDAVVVGVGTALADDPRLTPRNVRGAGPRFRAVMDSRLRTPPDARLLDAEGRGRPLILTVEEADPARRAALEDAGAEVVAVAADDSGRVAWEAAMEALAARDVMQVMLEGGGRLLTSAFEAGIIGKLVLIYAPLLIGGDEALSVWGGRGVGDLSSAPRLQRVRCRSLGDDWAIEGYPHAPGPISH